MRTNSTQMRISPSAVIKCLYEECRRFLYGTQNKYIQIILQPICNHAHEKLSKINAFRGRSPIQTHLIPIPYSHLFPICYFHKNNRPFFSASPLNQLVLTDDFNQISNFSCVISSIHIKDSRLNFIR